MKRWEHVLAPNTRNSRPTHLLFWDTESYIIKRENFTALPLRLWYAIYQRTTRNGKKRYVKEYSGKTADEFISLIERLTKQRTTLYIVSHNIKHDLGCCGLIPKLIHAGWTLKFMYEKSTTVIIRLHKENKRICFLDTLNYFTSPLSVLGKLVGLEKIELDFEHANDADLAERCKRDCEIIQQIFNEYIKFLDNGEYGDWKVTKAAQAFSIFRHKFMSIKIKIHDNEEALKMERQAYGGGLVRCYRVGNYDNDTFYQLDVNSMYPHIMATCQFPTALIGINEKCTAEKLADLIERRCVIADMTIKPSRSLYRHKTDKYITYPLYAFRGCFCTPEVSELLQEDGIIQIHRVAVYKRDYIFTDYVNHFYSKRLEYRKQGNAIYERFCKDLLNALYGKFGGKTGGLEPYPYPDELHGDERLVIRPDERKTYFIYWLDGIPYVAAAEAEAFNSFPGIAGHVTSYGRMYLQKLVYIAGIENVFYADTDSLIVNSAGYHNLEYLIQPQKLGCLKVEKVANKLAILARKDYRIGDKCTLKGIPNHQRSVNGNTYQRDIWPGLKATWGTKRNKEYGVTRQTVQLKRVIYDGTVTEDGFVQPFTFFPNL